MAIQGKYTFKGLDADNSYVRIVSSNVDVQDNMEVVQKTAAVYNSDGTIKTPAVMEDQWSISKVGRYIAYVYATKAVRDANPKDYITTINGSFEMDVKASAKNPVVQAYAAIKAEDAYKDYTDV